MHYHPHSYRCQAPAELASAEPMIAGLIARKVSKSFAPPIQDRWRLVIFTLGFSAKSSPHRREVGGGTILRETSPIDGHITRKRDAPPTLRRGFISDFSPPTLRRGFISDFSPPTLRRGFIGFCTRFSIASSSAKAAKPLRQAQGRKNPRGDSP
jgi:hypothetical protein